jgi:hydroxymethylpyrimidine kinase/phosphomethylpyrimidine kinase/thiamine-phosphate diphosphorylase
MRKEIGLYPIVDNSQWLEKLLPLGIKTIQLRIKNKENSELENEIKRSVALAKKYQANLFINDYWELAIRYNANGVHLGQEDLDTANIEMIRNAGLCFGISTHSDAEVARADALKPSYIAFGSIFPTTSKVMPYPAQGIQQLKRLRHQLLNYPLVAIGGINLERLPEVLAAHVDGIAVISAITQAENPIEMAKKLIAVISTFSLKP